MRRGKVFFSALLYSMILAAGSGNAATDQADSNRTRDIIYSRPDGTALTMDVFEPEKPNGASVLWLVSGGWFSHHGSISAKRISPIPVLVSRGYRVYAVVHRSSPRFTIEDAVADVERAVRFVRTREADEGRTSVPLGITGGSAGGHLSLMAGTTGDDGNPSAKDTVEQASSRVQAVACYFPPTDFLNYGDTSINVMETSVGIMFPASFDFQRQEKPDGDSLWNKAAKFTDVTRPEELRKILAAVSPAEQVTSDDAPALIIHGDNDKLVPLQQSKLMVKKMQAAGVDAKLIVKTGAAHGWQDIAKDNEKFADWFDKYLLVP